MRYPPNSARREPVRAIAAVGSGPVAQPSRSPSFGRRRFGNASIVFGAGLLLLLGTAVFLMVLAGLNWAFLPAALLVYGGIAVTALLGLKHHPHEAFGAPNVVTTIRAVATALFAGLILDVGQIDGGAREPWAWAFAGLALFALLLDGVDGYLARRLDLSSPYGARYDMEVDALLILLLSVLAYGLGKAGIFVLAIGLMRYAFLAAQPLFPWLAGDLPPSFRRKAVCVLQAAALGAVITPIVQPPFSNIAAMVTVAFLAWSFARDIVWLYRNGRAA